MAALLAMRNFLFPRSKLKKPNGMKPLTRRVWPPSIPQSLLNEIPALNHCFERLLDSTMHGGDGGVGGWVGVLQRTILFPHKGEGKKILPRLIKIRRRKWVLPSERDR